MIENSVQLQTEALSPKGRSALSPSPSSESTVLRAEGLHRTYGAGVTAVHACLDVSLQVHAGEMLVVRGSSGSGKTTLLNLLGGLDRPDMGKVWLADAEITAMTEDQLIALRRTQIGFVFQSFGLIPVLTAAENIEVPLRLQKMFPAQRDRRVQEVLELVGLTRHGQQRPSELSGGQQQRVGLARALACNPRVLIADEPTGQLDSSTAAAMMDLMSELVHQYGVAAVISTHDQLLMRRADRVVELHDGRIRF